MRINTSSAVCRGTRVTWLLDVVYYISDRPRSRLAHSSSRSHSSRAAKELSMAAQACTRKITADMKARISKAQGVKLNWNNSCSSKLLNTITAHSEAVGGPKEYIFFPLLTVSASFMGVHARMSIKLMKNGASQPFCGML